MTFFLKIDECLSHQTNVLAARNVELRPECLKQRVNLLGILFHELPAQRLHFAMIESPPRHLTHALVGVRRATDDQSSLLNQKVKQGIV